MEEGEEKREGWNGGGRRGEGRLRGCCFGARGKGSADWVLRVWSEGLRRC